MKYGELSAWDEGYDQGYKTGYTLDEIHAMPVVEGRKYLPSDRQLSGAYSDGWAAGAADKKAGKKSQKK